MEVGWDPVLVTVTFWINGGRLDWFFKVVSWFFMVLGGHILDQWRSVGLVFQGGFMVFNGFGLVSMVFQGSFMVFGWFPWFWHITTLYNSRLVLMVPDWFFMVPCRFL